MHIWSRFDWPHQTVQRVICTCWKVPHVGAHVEASAAASRLPSVFVCPLARARRLRDRSPASEALRVPARRSGPLSLMPRLVQGPCGSTRQITLPLSHHFCWQKCSPPHYFALSGSTPHPARVLQKPQSPPSPPAPACAAPPNFYGGFCCCWRQNLTLKPTQVDTV